MSETPQAPGIPPGTFPLEARPSADYHVRPRAFGSPRDSGARKHAGCDLYAPAGSPVFAVADGRVALGPYLFYDVVFALEVGHPGLGVVRYGEILGHVPAGVQPGAQVTAGQLLGYVGKMRTVAESMLHFELYSGTGAGPLTVRADPPYMRRADLVDPTEFLDACEVKS